jgi:hypothetical protein
MWHIMCETAIINRDADTYSLFASHIHPTVSPSGIDREELRGDRRIQLRI